RIVDDYHRTVIQVSHTLVVLFAFLQDEHPHRLPRQHDRFQSVRQLVDIQHLDPAQLGNLIQVEIVGDDLAPVKLGQFDQLQVDLAHLGEIVLHDTNLQIRDLLDALQDVQASPAAVPLQRVRGIRYHLQLAQHELR